MFQMMIDKDRYESDDSQHQIGQEGYAARGSREAPQQNDTTPETLPQEDHMEFCHSYRQDCQWHQGKEFVKLKKERGSILTWS